MDPYGVRSDDEVWGVLSDVALEAYVAALPEGLRTFVGDGKALFSTGQKQLLCLARAIL